MSQPTTYRPHRYRRQMTVINPGLVPITFLREQLTELAECWQKKEISGAHFAALYLLWNLTARYGTACARGPGMRFVATSLAYPLWPKKLPRSAHFERWLDDPTSAGEALAKLNFVSLPLRARETLSLWLRGEWPLWACTKIPSVDEILKAQLQGTRYVSMLLPPDNWLEEIHEGRDNYSFFLHDLLHAYEFMSRPEKKYAQMATSWLTHQAHQSEFIVKLRQQHNSLTERLEYMISDLNTHPLHWWKIFFTTLMSCGLVKSASNRELFYEIWGWPSAWREIAEKFCAEASPKNANDFINVFKVLGESLSQPQSMLVLE